MIRTGSWVSPSRLLPRLLAGLTVLVVVGSPAPAAGTTAPTAPTVTWAVQPADPSGPDGRRWIEATLDPGQVTTEHLAVRNFSDTPVVFALKAADGYLTDRGRFTMLSSDRESVDGGTWIRVRERVRVAARSTTVVPFTISAPADATPGDHPAGIAATLTSSGGTVAVESRVGFRVMLRASGTVTAALAVTDLTTEYRRSWNPFSAGTVLVTYTGTNRGNVAVTGRGRVTTGHLFGLTDRGTAAPAAELLPGGRRQVTTRLAGVWGIGPLRTTVDVTPAVRGGDPTGAVIRPTTAAVTLWVLPWPQLALAALVAGLLLAYRITARKRRRRLARLLARARDEGRAEARTSASAAG
ncbi:hypothetical protein [Micromonospora cathayae]|uniref:DUF916 domain-containing protein n=1 Tax=Micromonospora cathayae TaxID=3028804 RepID=A0ABY7ZLG6_9ACTN|nr:hypothetical protein [Micromonospora sp. HUAS 3]WDZ82749.1 hypothetical protein PVK37_20000 [Micromonospora sp. HUAS 3]